MKPNHPSIDDKEIAPWAQNLIAQNTLLRKQNADLRNALDHDDLEDNLLFLVALFFGTGVLVGGFLAYVFGGAS